MEARSVTDVVGYAPLGDALRLVDAGLEEATSERGSLIEGVARHLLTAGGKRIRPAITVLAGELFSPGSGDVVAIAVAVELVHLGSLYHDDVIDEAEVRRGVPTVNAVWSNTVAILAGDFLLARASEIAAGLGAEPARILGATVARLVAGEVREIELTHNPDAGVAAYEEVIAAKTASVMAAAGRLGALVAGAPVVAVEAAERFGSELGMAFQIADDVLDLVAEENVTGKEAGRDVIEGVYTLPVLLALERDAGGELRGLLRADPTPEDVTAVRDLVADLGGVGAALAVARGRLAGAEAALGELPAGPAREGLGRLARFVLERLDS